MVALLDDRSIDHWHSSRITRLDVAARTAHLQDDRTLAYDLLIGVPVHVAPTVVLESGLAEDGWIPVDRATMQTRFADVFAVGDVTSAPVPRAGTMAEAEARTVADVLISRVTGSAPPPPFAGQATCYIEMGGDTVATVEIDFLSGPAPSAVFSPPARATVAQKQEFGASRRRRWFNLD
jgi:sulfide:quinone oxidoreductase